MSIVCQGKTTKPQPRPAETPQPAVLATRYSLLMLPAVATAALLYLCYFPADCGWLAWIALVPLLCLVRSAASARRIYLAAWLGGLVFFWIGLQWIRVADPRMYATWASLATYCSIYFPLGIGLVRQLDRRTQLPLVVTVPLVWTALEFFRGHFLLGGFAWYFLGHTQHAFLPLIQIADLAGVYAVTALIAAVNAFLFEILYAQRSFRARLALPLEGYQHHKNALCLQAVAIGVLLAGTLGYGAWRLSQQDFGTGPRIALLQGNLLQRLRNEATAPDALEDKILVVRRHFGKLADEAARQNVDLIVWPETSFAYSWLDISPLLHADRIPDDWKQAADHQLQLASAATRRWPTNLLLGMNASGLDADAHPHRYNSAVFIQRDGQIGGRYDKMHCVPFGEYVPYRDWLPWMNSFAPYDFDYSITPGQKQTRFALGKYHFGVIICYEDTDPFLARQYARAEAEQPAVDFLVNISNDGWFGSEPGQQVSWFDGHSELEQHLAICRFRAIECRRAVARAVNMGISAVINSNGKIIRPEGDWAKSEGVEAVVTESIPIDQRVSLYARWGDWLPWGCWLVLGAGLVGGRLWPTTKFVAGVV